MAWSLLKSLLSLHLLPVSSSPTEALPYLGRGYNVIIGNPHPKGADVGWGDSPVDPIWIRQEAGDDPEASGWVSPVKFCDYSASSSEIHGGKTAQTSMMSEWNVGAGTGMGKWLDISFTASASTKTMNQSIWSEDTSYFDVRSTCILYTAQLPAPTLPYTLKPNFKALVAMLPTQYSQEAHNFVKDKLVDYFGTHYAYKFATGGMMGQRSWMKKSSYKNLVETMKSSGQDVSVAAKGWLWKVVDPKGTGGHQKDKDATEAFETAQSSGGTEEFCLGCDQFVPGDFSAWSANLEDNQVPVGSDVNELVPISRLLTSLHFPDDADIESKQIVVEQAMARICDDYAAKGCTEWPVDLLDVPPQTIPEGSRVYAVAWSPDGGAVVSGSYDRFVRKWDVVSGKSIWNGHEHSASVRSVAYSRDGTRIASCALDHTPRIWDAATGKCMQTLSGHTGAVNSVAWSPDGHIASGSADHTILIWDAATGKHVQNFSGHTAAVNSVAWSPDGGHIASGSNQTILIWDAATGKLVHTLSGHTGAVNSVAWSPDGHIASGSSDHTIRIWDAATGKRVHTLSGHTSWLNSVAWSPDGGHIASGSADRTILIWDAATGKCVQTLTGTSSTVWSVAWSPDGFHIVSGSKDETIRIWDVKVDANQAPQPKDSPGFVTV